MNYTLITDGAYSSKRNKGGIGIVFLKNDIKILEYSQAFNNTTNNQMELLAVLIGLKFIKKPINNLLIITDSMYVIGCAIKGWKRKKNTELWNKFDKEYNRVREMCPNITFKHIHGHTGDKWNTYCDNLAVNASK